MKNILIIHPEGNINNNPFLDGAVRTLCALGHSVTIASFARNHYQYAPCAGAELVLTSDGAFKLPEDRAWHCVLGVDADGMQGAAPFARQVGARLGMISFEIFFEGEVGRNAKLAEILSCRGVDFAVVQDDVRAMLLQHENHIPRARILTIPLASAGARPRSSAGGALHERFGLPPGTRIALMAGSLSTWSMIDTLLASAAVWPEEWRILVHARYGLREDEKALIAVNNSAGRILTSETALENLDDMGQLTDHVDLGVAFYTPSFQSKYTGNNLKYLGMASGKINSYLRHGLPVLCNEIGLMSEEIERHRLGFSISSVAEIPSVLAGYDRSDYEANCLDYFRTRLDLDRNIGPFLEAVLTDCP